MATSIDHLLAESDWLDRLALALCPPGEAGDSAQETWLAVVTASRRGTWRDDVRNVRAWMTTILRRELGDSQREKRRRERREALVAQPLERSVPSTLDVVERMELQRDVANAVLELKEPYRTTILLRFFESLGDADVAARMGVATSTVSTRVARGLAQLRTKFDSKPDRRAGIMLLAAARDRSNHLLAPSALRLGGWLLGIGATVTLVWITQHATIPQEVVPSPHRALAEPGPALAVAVATDPVTRVPLVAPAVALLPVAADERDRALLALLGDAARASAATQRGAWRGHRFESIPLAIYQPGEWALVIHHDALPESYVEQPGQEALAPLFRGPATDAMTANTSGSLFGRPAAFVSIEGVSASRASGSDLALLLHECGHAFRAMGGGEAGRWPIEEASIVAEYPALDPHNNALGRIEGRLLDRALCATDLGTKLAECRSFCVVRKARQEALAEKLRTFEQRLEANEGLAEYFAARVMLALGNCEPFPLKVVPRTDCGADGAWMRDFRARLSRINVGGQGATRDRFYLTGATLALLLDGMRPNWQDEVESGASLQEILHATVTANADLPSLDEVLNREGFTDLLAEEASTTEILAAHRRARLSSVISAGSRTLVLDLSRVGGAGDARSFDPMNLIAIDEARRLHTRMLEIGLPGGSAAFSRPVLQDLDAGLLIAALPAAFELEHDGTATRAASHVVLHAAGIEFQCGAANVVTEESRIVIAPVGAGTTSVLDAAALARLDDKLAKLRLEASAPIAVPALSLTTVDGRVVSLADGVPRIIVFCSAAPWAQPSQEFVLGLTKELDPRERTDRLAVIASQCTASQVEELRARLAAQTLLIHDPERRIAPLFGVVEYPLGVECGRDGIQHVVSRGNSAESRAAIQRVLERP